MEFCDGLETALRKREKTTNSENKQNMIDGKEIKAWELDTKNDITLFHAANHFPNTRTMSETLPKEEEAL